MIIEMQEGSANTELSFQRWAVGLVGKAIDERGEAAIEFAVANCDVVLEVDYQPDTFSITCAGHLVPADDFPQYLSSIAVGSLLLECSTLGLAEIFLCCKGRLVGALRTNFLYVEPKTYKSAQRQGL